jgi:hypothetical protein
MKARLYLLGLAVFVCISNAQADHCPESSITAGTPDLVLASIDLSHAHIEDVINRFGVAASSNEAPVEGGPSGSGSGTHVWQIGRARLTAATEFYRDKSGKKIESVLMLSVEGPDRATALQTGRGVGLGDTPGKIKSVYGPQFLNKSINAPRPVGTMLGYCFSDESELVFGIEQGRVTSIMLYISEE